MRQKFLRTAARKANFSYNEALVLRGSTVYQFSFICFSFVFKFPLDDAAKQKSVFQILTIIVGSRVQLIELPYEWRMQLTWLRFKTYSNHIVVFLEKTPLGNFFLLDGLSSYYLNNTENT